MEIIESPSVIKKIICKFNVDILIISTKNQKLTDRFFFFSFKKLLDSGCKQICSEPGRFMDITSTC